MEWVLRAALHGISEDDREVLGGDCRELIVLALATTAVMERTFTSYQLARIARHPNGCRPLTETEAGTALDAGVRGGLLVRDENLGFYSIVDDDMKEPLRALYGVSPASYDAMAAERP